MTVLTSGQPQRVTGGAPGEQSDVSVAVLTNGDFVVAWSDTDPSFDVIRVQRFGPDENPFFPVLTLPALNNVDQPDIVALSGGRYAVVYRQSINNGDILGVINNGGSFGLPFLIRSNADAVSMPDVSATADGDLFVAWRNDSTSNVEAVRITTSGATAAVGTVQTVGAYSAFDPYVTTAALTNGNFVTLARTGDSTVAFRIYDGSTGAAVNTLTTAFSGGSYGEVAITPLRGGFFAAARDILANSSTLFGTSLVGRAYTAAGAEATPQLFVGVPAGFSDALTRVDWPELIGLPNGELFVAGYNSASGAHLAGTATVVNATTNAVVDALTPVSAISVSATTSVNNTHDYARLPDGRIVGVFAAFTDDAGTEVFFQILDPRDGLYVGTNAADRAFGHEVRSDEMHGGAGDDTLTGLGGDDKLIGGLGNDQLSGGAGEDVIDGGDGYDTANYSGARNFVLIDLSAGFANYDGENNNAGGVGNLDRLFSIEAITGSNFGDAVTGDGVNNVITARGGADIVFARGGDDFIDGGSGNDTLVGESGNDRIVGGAGNDRIEGGDGYDAVDFANAPSLVLVNLEAGVVNFDGEGGNDVLLSIEAVTGSNFGDAITGNGDNNSIIAQGGGDTVFARGGDDYVDGGSGGDSLVGEAGNDSLLGGGDNDTLEGGVGQDTLVGGFGSDTLTGGGDADRFVFGQFDALSGGAELITDFQLNIDKIDLSGIDAIAGGGDDAFTFVGVSATPTSAGSVSYFVDGSTILVRAFIDGDAVPDVVIRMGSLAAISSTDFIL
jgi:Ca2+-binding RTX toxin-like protein